jgi:hypothetical protein
VAKRNKKILLKNEEFFFLEYFIRISKSGKKFPYTRGKKEIIQLAKVPIRVKSLLLSEKVRLVSRFS